MFRAVVFRAVVFRGCDRAVTRGLKVQNGFAVMSRKVKQVKGERKKEKVKVKRFDVFSASGFYFRLSPFAFHPRDFINTFLDTELRANLLEPFNETRAGVRVINRVG
jgi:hypothetical protein